MKELVRTREHAKHMRQQYEGKISEMETEVQQVTLMITIIIMTTIVIMIITEVILINTSTMMIFITSSPPSSPSSSRTCRCKRSGIV
jgi:hypothetical protein